MKKLCLLLAFMFCLSTSYAQWTTSGSNTYINSGKVGIGTSTPETSLHVNSNTPILSTGTGPGFKLRDINSSPTNKDWFMYAKNGNFYIAQGEYNLDSLGGGYKTANKLQIASDGTVISWKALYSNSYFYGQGDFRLFPLEGEQASGTAVLGGWSYSPNKTVDLQLSTWAGNNRVPVMRLTSTGNVGIGTTTPGNYRLAVEGKIGAREIEVKTGNWADFVFKPSYTLRSLAQVERFIRANGHLPDMPSEAEVNQKGVALGEMNVRLLQKIEELTLYSIQQQKQHRRQQQQISLLQKELAALKKGIHVRR